MVETAELIEGDELGRPECLRLLAGEVVGRIIYSEAAMPAARPVTYVLDGDQIVFRTTVGSSFALATRNTVVAFEVDIIDPADLTGWTVLGIGTSYPVTEPDRLSVLGGPAPAAEGGTRQVVAVRLGPVSGHRLGPAVRRRPSSTGPSTVATADGREGR